MGVPRSADVVIIGGGPAGSTAGAYLAQKGYDVVLLEKRKYPRYNVGESLIPHFWRYCDLTGVTKEIEAGNFVCKSGGTVVWNGVIRQFRFADFGHARPAMHVERDQFDDILLNHARTEGVQVFEEVSVVGIKLDPDESVTVTFRFAVDNTPGEIRCRFVVDASGQSAVIAKQFGVRVLDEGFRFMSVWGYFKGSKYVAFDGRAYPFEKLREVLPTTFVASVGEKGGWVWHIPLKEDTSVGFVLPLDEVKGLKSSDAALEAFFLAKCSGTPILNRLLESAQFCKGSIHVIRDYSYRPTQLAGTGFFLIGDAAAFIDPIFSVGVVLAMYSAYIAAWAIDRSFKQPASTARNQGLFAGQLRGRFEVSRSLAIPQYGPLEGGSDLARRSVQFEKALEQELMYVVSTLTTRSENFAQMARKGDGESFASNRFRVLPNIAF